MNKVFKRLCTECDYETFTCEKCGYEGDGYKLITEKSLEEKIQEIV